MLLLTTNYCHYVITMSCVENLYLEVNMYVKLVDVCDPFTEAT